MKEEGYEVEIKCLLGGRKEAEQLAARMQAIDPKLEKDVTHKQLNHYFHGKGAFRTIAKVLKNNEDRRAFLDLAEKAKDFSLRTREADGRVLLVLKAAIDDTTSANGTARREFEKEVDMPLAKLDETILKAGFTYQAKWSRERTEYQFKGVNVTIDKNAGYGYLAEFEIVGDDPARAEADKTKLRELIKKVGLEELNQVRLARMFAHYNTHWQEYYGTEKIFVIP